MNEQREPDLSGRMDEGGLLPEHKLSWPWFPHLRIMDDYDVFGGPGGFGMVHNRVFLQTRDTTGRQDLIVLVHTQGLPSKILHWKSLTETYKPNCWPNQAPQKDITFFYYIWKVRMNKNWSVHSTTPEIIQV